MAICFQGPRSKVMWRIRSKNSLQKLKGVTNCTRGVFSYLGTLLKILHFGLLCNVATLALNVATSVLPLFGTSRRWIPTLRRWKIASLQRSDIGSQCRDVGLYLLWNVAMLVLNPLWNVATLSPNVATLPLFIALKPLFFFLPYHHTPLHTHIPAPPVATSDHLTAFASTGLPPPTVVLRPCLVHPPPRSGALALASIGSL